MKTVKRIVNNYIVLLIFGATAGLILWASGVEALEPPVVNQLPDSANQAVTESKAPQNADNSQLEAIRQADALLEGSPMASLGRTIVETAEAQGVSWKLVIGIAHAESSLGRAFVHPYDVNCGNYWGIKPPGGRRDDGSYLRCYYTPQDGVNSIVGLLARRYKDATPEEMNGVYVQPKNQNWLKNVNQYYLIK